LAERNNLGIAFFRTGMLEDAVREFRRALEVGPSDVIARFHLALISIRMERYGEAARELEQLARETGLSFAFASNLAVALRRMNRTDDALHMLDEADRLRPGTPATALSRAITLAEGHRLSEAAPQFDDYRARLGDGERPIAAFYYHAGLAAALSGDVRRAQAIVWEGLESHADSPALLLLAGLTAEKQEDRQGAELFYRRALEAEPGLAQGHKNLGDIAYARGAAEEALRLYQRAVELDSELGEDVHARLGLLHYQTRNREAAIRAWTRALELNPANEAVRNRLEVLLHATT
jgi:tetratricopeptide (TPR) repeat protein